MNDFLTWGEVIAFSFQDLWVKFINFLPKLLAAFLIFVIGWAIAVGLGKLIARVAKILWIDKGLEKLGVHAAFQKAGVNFNFAGLLGWIVKWFLIIVFLIAAADILGLSQITSFLNRVVLYIPNVIIAVVVLVLGLVVANFVREVVKKSIDATHFKGGHFVAGVAKWAVVVFSFMAAMVQLGVATSLIQILFTGFVAMVALAGGLAFGLGGREWAQQMMASLKRDITE
jgi:hypothetical protein